MGKPKPWYYVVTPREDLRERNPLDTSEFAVNHEDILEREGEEHEDIHCQLWPSLVHDSRRATRPTWSRRSGFGRPRCFIATGCWCLPCSSCCAGRPTRRRLRAPSRS